MATTVITVEDEVKLAIQDLPSGLGAAGSYLSDQLLRGFIFQRVITAGTFTLTRYGSGPIFKDDAYGEPNYALYFDNQSTPFSAEGAETYDIFARGLKVYLKTGSRTASTISILGTLVDFDRIMADVFWYLANHHSQQISSSIASASMTPDAVYRNMIAQHEFYKGVVTSGS